MKNEQCSILNEGINECRRFSGRLEIYILLSILGILLAFSELSVNNAQMSIQLHIFLNDSTFSGVTVYVQHD